MNILLGYFTLLVCVFGGFALSGGHLAAIWQPLELVIIGGAAAGAAFAAFGISSIKASLIEGLALLTPSKIDKKFYMELFSLLYEILAKIRKEGLMSIEGDIENEQESSLFQKYKKIKTDSDIMEFISTYLRIIIGGNLNSYELENLMNNDIETKAHEKSMAATFFSYMADGMPAFGIVAAVLGVVHTMEAVGQPPAVLGLMIAHALVGTFLGILIAYGFVSPLAKLLEARQEKSIKAFQVIQTVILANLNGYAPQVCIEFGRVILSNHERPSFVELEGQIKQMKNR